MYMYILCIHMYIYTYLFPTTSACDLNSGCKMQNVFLVASPEHILPSYVYNIVPEIVRSFVETILCV